MHLIAVEEPLGAALLESNSLGFTCFRARLDVRQHFSAQPGRLIQLLGFSLNSLLVLLNLSKSARAVKALGVLWLERHGLQEICDSLLFLVMPLG